MSPLARLESFVADLPRRPARMVIEGEAGIGKTTVWRAGVDAATSRGYHVLVCRPAEAETRLAYSGLADLLGRFEDRAFDGLPEPQRRALDAALLRCAPTGRAPEARAIFTAFGGVVRALARDVPVVVAVDDRQWLDASSARALEYVARRLVAEPVGMLTAQRTPPAPAPSGEDELLRLGPLTAAGLHRLHLALGDDAAVVATLERSIQLVEQDGVIAPFRRAFLPDAIEALVHLGDLDRAGHLTKLLDECARALRQRAAILSAARCRALIHAARGDVEAALAGLDAALTESPSVPMPLDLARALIVKGQLERRCKHRRHAAASLGTALDICERIGARLWAERARSELARLGARADGDALTATEAQVARLAASGLTNRQVAAAAFLSPKTVEANISRIYRKLGIHSRAELGARLADHDPSAG